MMNGYLNRDDDQLVGYIRLKFKVSDRYLLFIVIQMVLNLGDYMRLLRKIYRERRVINKIKLIFLVNVFCQGRVLVCLFF